MTSLNQTITAAEFLRSGMPAPPVDAPKSKKKRNKYGVSSKADRTYKGTVYASKAEAMYARRLDNSGTQYTAQPRIKLGPSGIVYVPDFLINATYVDVKGMETPVFRLKMKLWKAHGPGTLQIVKYKDGKFVVDREIQPTNGKAAK